MANLNMEFYKGENEYTDGISVENEILEIVRNQGHVNHEVLKNVSWPIFYHLSPLRENILNWYPFKEGCSILEVGSGCGALTGLLCEKANYVASVELTKTRATINYERHKHCDNLDIFVGNLENITFEGRFDYIIVNGVLEYAGSFISGTSPYETFLRRLSAYLNDDGSILVGIENRLGLKYFSGAKEDHTGELFEGLDGYKTADRSVKTFSKNEIINLMDRSGLKTDQFYYPFPDYKFPDFIYTDDGFDKIPLSYDTHSYDEDRYMFFEEVQMQNQLINENAKGIFANSFLIVASKSSSVMKDENNILFVKVNSNRDDAYKICTVLYTDGDVLKVKKRPLTIEAITHLKNMESHHKQMDGLKNMTLLPVEIIDKDLVYDFVQLPTVEVVLLEKKAANDVLGFKTLLTQFYQMLDSTTHKEINDYSKGFHSTFGQLRVEEDLEFTNFKNIDVLFDNVFYDEHQNFKIFDYEWILECKLPVKFIFWRSVKDFFEKYGEQKWSVSDIEVYDFFGISNEMIDVFYKWEAHFSENYVKMFNKIPFQKETIKFRKEMDVFNANHCSANLYLDTGSGFNDNEKEHAIYDATSERIVLTFDLAAYSNIKNIRFDPVEGKLSVCDIISAKVNGEPVEATAYNKYPFHANGDLFLTTDPMYLFTCPQSQSVVFEIEFAIRFLIASQINDEIENSLEVGKSVNKQLEIFRDENEKLKQVNHNLINETESLHTRVSDLLTQQVVKDLKFEAITLEKNKLSDDYYALINSTTWKITKPVRVTMDKLKKFKTKTINLNRESLKLLRKTKQNIKSYGWKKTVHKIRTKGHESLSNVKKSNEIAENISKDSTWKVIEKWINETPHEFIDIFHVPMGWNTPLFQRFQHLSIQAGNVGGISFYGAHPLVDKDIEVFKFISPTLCIVNLDNYEIKKGLFELLDRQNCMRIIRLQSIDLATTIEELEVYLSKGYHIVYEYIDEITPQITGDIPKFVMERHQYVLANEQITVVATSDKLYGQIEPYRNNNMEMITNGVDFEHWNIDRGDIPCPADVQYILDKKKIIVGYHGALAQWIDYKLLNRIADDKRFELLLIGYEHDDSLKESRILLKDNVHFIGSRPYSELSKYSAFYDIAILPFVMNDLTKSVSPVKIFEYMAQNKPIVTYALPECLKYKSCIISYSEDEFVKNLDKALSLRFDESYLALMKSEALGNTWKSIMEKTIALVNSNHVPLVGVEQDVAVYQSTPKYVQETNWYRNMKKVFWKTPFMSNSLKSKFIYRVKRKFKPELLNYEVANNKDNTEDTEIRMAATPENTFQSDYISQILGLPESGRDSYVPITDESYQFKKGDPKIIAYYLTQFHPDKHNEEWWGKGVTEWNNVCRAVPQFVGHYQPRLPGELGFYDLRIKENMLRQIELAKMYGVHGFSFYYYWFDGERLLEKPIEMFLSDQSLDFPFSICWANENWTRRFDGTNTDILMEQPKTVESYQEVMHDMIRFLKDDRYITVENKKVITVYRPSLIPEPKKIIQYWRKYCADNGAGELYIIGVKENMVEMNLLEIGFDAISEFHPGTVYQNSKNITEEINYIRKDFSGQVFDYRDLVENQRYFEYNLPKLYRAVMPMWDNTARRNNKGMIYHGATPDLYKRWLKDVINEGANRTDIEERMVFINAWNEWGEGAYLEPDKKYGYAYLQATKEAVEETRGE
ncbi:glycoside hydrolase family 99-like domain-containing protein [Paenibacillus sp. FSL K6-0108]|uniref:glycoside hydrolase family 99-like domain-containing protein n=1 Tax=Paenibacillus sp. FSL K6-0108 TaxID=2921417 RepID=UPI00324D6EBE